MTGLKFAQIVRRTAYINFVYLIYVFSALLSGVFPFSLIWQKALFLIFMVNMSIHARLGMWTVITDYIPESLQKYFIRAIELYIVIIFAWVVIILC